MTGRRIGVLGLARSGRAAAKLALAHGDAVYASDAGDSPALRIAAEEIRAAGGSADVGGHSVAELAACDLIVLSPGIPPDAKVLQDPALDHVGRVSELEYAYQALRSSVIAITGTNGKSTTTALTAHLLQSAGFDAPAAGNIGVALSEVALRDEPPAWVVIEASSFQLADIETFTPTIGVLTNLSPDHLDRYADVEAYYGDKKRLFDNASPASIWVLNAEDPEVLRLAGRTPGVRRMFRVASQPAAAEEGAFVDDGGEMRVRLNGTETSLGSVTGLRLLGRHNHANALAAALAALAAGAATGKVADGLRSFGGLEHRFEAFLEHAGVVWINDSKATNVGSALVALESLDRPAVALLGGRDKGESYAPLLPALKTKARAVIAFGEARAKIVAELGEHIDIEQIDDGFERVVARAAELAQPGDAVLLAPACASFDMFVDYEDRGRRFKALAAQLATVQHG
jgi:UDP-N-acetylmuramoylalanine--D-glutamate ligase